ncbi:papain family cysteine protease [Ancylostoma ceylanicum]|uniref:Papain family cysteine protease n=1 Tax=Ancylostoma ceylanicum TaxID=53326 RepID=A0A0D6LZ00_9BILA|nr:papain family cysteine protease [Ancylostoma ceylanicum]
MWINFLWEFIYIPKEQLGKDYVERAALRPSPPSKPASLVMWPKLTKKSKDIDFERLEISEGEDVPSKKRTWFIPVLYQLVDLVAVVVQSVLVGAVIYLFLKMSFILYNRVFAAVFQELIPSGSGIHDSQFYNKTYTDEAERDFRFSVFITNVRYFEEEEKKHPGLDLDVTQFADWTEEEMKKVSSKNISQCGSCWAFATAASVEAGHAIKTGRLTTLSEQEMVDCDTRNNGCNGGFVKEHGLMKEAEYPYRGTDDNMCLLTKNSTDRVFIRDYRTLSTNEEVVADWIAANGPATFGMNVTKALYSYRSGVFTPSKEDCEEHSLGSHALTIVGYGAEGGKPFWLVKNSWGSRWGQGGYFKLARGVNACGAANNVVAPIL